MRDAECAKLYVRGIEREHQDDPLRKATKIEGAEWVECANTVFTRLGFVEGEVVLPLRLREYGVDEIDIMGSLHAGRLEIVCDRLSHVELIKKMNE